MAKITFKMIDGEIAQFSTDANTLNERAHYINVLILKQLAPTFCGDDFQGSGDMSRVPRMVMAMPASWRRTEEIRWWQENTPCRVKYSNGNVQSFGFDRRYIALAKKHKNDPEALEAARKLWWNPEQALSVPFFAMAEKNSEQDVSELTIDEVLKMVHALGKRIGKKAEEDGVNDNDEATVLALAESLANMKAPAKAKAKAKAEEAIAA